MELTKVRLFKKSDLGSKAYSQNVAVGRWFKFYVPSCGEDLVGFGKVVRIIDENFVEVEKYFELPDYRPYASTNWYDRLPMAI